MPWSDGTPLSAADVRFTYEYVTNPKVGVTTAAMHAAVASVDMMDPDTVRVNFKDVNPAWSLPFVGIAGMIIPEHMFPPADTVERRGGAGLRKPVGRGPYRLISMQSQECPFSATAWSRRTRWSTSPIHLSRPDRPYFGRVEV